MKYAGIIKNDFASAPGVCLTLFTQGCPHRCEGCHNPETWDFDGGKEFTYETMSSILHGLIANNFIRDLCIQGGEPLCPENLDLVKGIISTVKIFIPQAVIYIWTGYTYENLLATDNDDLKYILETADFLIDGPYIAAERDITLLMRGSRNQRIINLKTGKDITNDT